MDGNYDELELATVPADVARAPDSVVFEYDDLNASEQQAVESAAASRSYRQCHRFDDARSGVEALGDRIRRRCERVAGDPPCGERTYVEYDGDYYAVEVRVLDVTVADSIDEG